MHYCLRLSYFDPGSVCAIRLGGECQSTAIIPEERHDKGRGGGFARTGMGWGADMCVKVHHYLHLWYFDPKMWARTVYAIRLGGCADRPRFFTAEGMGGCADRPRFSPQRHGRGC